jgi:hypothetical protein
MKLTGETKGLALVLDTAPLRRWSRLKVSPAGLQQMAVRRRRAPPCAAYCAFTC